MQTGRNSPRQNCFPAKLLGFSLSNHGDCIIHKMGIHTSTTFQFAKNKRLKWLFYEEK
jgi:hypothetical protein